MWGGVGVMGWGGWALFIFYHFTTVRFDTAVRTAQSEHDYMHTHPLKQIDMLEDECCCQWGASPDMQLHEPQSHNGLLCCAGGSTLFEYAALHTTSQ